MQRQLPRWECLNCRDVCPAAADSPLCASCPVTCMLMCGSPPPPPFLPSSSAHSFNRSIFSRSLKPLRQPSPLEPCAGHTAAFYTYGRFVMWARRAGCTAATRRMDGCCYIVRNAAVWLCRRACSANVPDRALEPAVSESGPATTTARQHEAHSRVVFRVATYTVCCICALLQPPKC